MTDDEELPQTVIYLSTSVLIWLFGVLVFLPLAEEIDPGRLSLLVSLMIFSACSFFLLKGFKGLGQVLDITSNIFTEKYAQGKKQKNTKRTRRKMRTAVEVGALVVVYLFYFPLLSRFHPSISGVAFIIAGLWILWTLLKGVQGPESLSA